MSSEICSINKPKRNCEPFPHETKPYFPTIPYGNIKKVPNNQYPTKNEIAFNDVFQIQPFSYKSKNERKKYIVQVSSFYSNQTYYWEKKRE